MGPNIGTIPKNMLTNFELKRLKPKLDIVKKPKNLVHELDELTDSKVSGPYQVIVHDHCMTSISNPISLIKKAYNVLSSDPCPNYLPFGFHNSHGSLK